MGSLLRLTAVGGKPVGVIDLSVFVVGKTDGAVIAPVPAAIGNNSLDVPLRINHFQLSQEFCFSAVLVFQSVGAAAAPIPAVRQLESELVFTSLQKSCHIASLVLDTLFIVGMSRRQHRRANLCTIETALIQPAGGDIEPDGLHILRRTLLSKTVYQIAHFLVDLVAASNPCRFPVLILKQPHLKKSGTGFSLLIFLIPKFHTPEDSLATLQRFSFVLDVGHPGRTHLSRIPNYLAATSSDDLIGSLLFPSFADPEKTGMYVIYTHGIFHVFCS